jgi:hypothetical protein
MKRILDKSFRYVPSHATDVAKTIKREQERLKAQREVMEHKLIQISRKRSA